MFEICLCEQLAKTVERNSESDVQVNLNLLEAFIFSRVEVVFYTDRLLFQSFLFSGVVFDAPANIGAVSLHICCHNLSGTDLVLEGLPWHSFLTCAPNPHACMRRGCGWSVAALSTLLCSELR